MVQVEELILGKLEECAREGFSATAVEAAVNTIEFSLRENNTGSFPRGLSLMLRASAAWIYDRDPFRPLQWTEDLEHFKVCSTLGNMPCFEHPSCPDVACGETCYSG